jgi:hypothetical protein
MILGFLKSTGLLLTKHLLLWKREKKYSIRFQAKLFFQEIKWPRQLEIDRKSYSIKNGKRTICIFWTAISAFLLAKGKKVCVCNCFERPAVVQWSWVRLRFRGREIERLALNLKTQREKREQGDQIGRIFVYWAIVFLNIYRRSPHFWADFSPR